MSLNGTYDSLYNSHRKSLVLSEFKTVDIYIKKDLSLEKNSIVLLNVSFEGNWHMRGHVNHHDVSSIIELQTGLVIDKYVMSNYCLSCAKGYSMSEPTYLELYKFHKPSRQNNSTGLIYRCMPSHDTAVTQFAFCKLYNCCKDS